MPYRELPVAAATSPRVLLWARDPWRAALAAILFGGAALGCLVLGLWVGARSTLSCRLASPGQVACKVELALAGLTWPEEPELVVRSADAEEERDRRGNSSTALVLCGQRCARVLGVGARGEEAFAAVATIRRMQAGEPGPASAAWGVHIHSWPFAVVLFVIAALFALSLPWALSRVGLAHDAATGKVEITRRGWPWKRIRDTLDLAVIDGATVADHSSPRGGSFDVRLAGVVIVASWSKARAERSAALLDEALRRWRQELAAGPAAS